VHTQGIPQTKKEPERL